MPVFNTTQPCCSPFCALEFIRANNTRKFKRETTRQKSAARLLDKPYQLRMAQSAFNGFIRFRDKDLPCVSCGAIKYKITCGHYKTVGAHPALRFEEDNAAGQCWWNCNRNKSGNIIEYRKELIIRIGVKRVEWIEGPHEPLNLALHEIIEIKKYYREKIKR